MSEFLDADEAAEFLGVQRTTIYAYVSRGLLESVSAGDDRRRTKYRRSDLARLKRRADAGSGHGPAASTALDWGAPSLETEVAAITPRGPIYRGHRLKKLVEAGYSFESVAELLWGGDLVEPESWPTPEPEAVPADDLLHRSAHPTEHLTTVVQYLRLDDVKKYSKDPRATLECARRVVRGAAGVGGAIFGGETAVDAEESLAATLAAALGIERSDDRIDLLNRTLVVVAEHGLNCSTFAGRVAASSGADLYACVIASVSAFGGPLHGLMSERVRTVVREVERASEAEDVVLERLRRGDEPPGFGHPLYEHGDPREQLLRTAAREVAGTHEGLDVLEAIGEAGERAGLPPRNLDFGIAAVAEALDLRVGAGPFLFAVGRMAGWLAHAIEQRGRDELLRPRAEYVGDDA